VASSNEDVVVSYFIEALQQWQDLNCTAEFKSFSREIQPLCQSIPLLLYHKRSIVDIILKHLSSPSTLAFDAILA
jgi:U3 small nucleolar RNA-associated protein 20